MVDVTIEYKRIAYRILKSSSPGVWMWWVMPPQSTPIHGTAKSMSGAAFAAQRAIKKWLQAHAAEDNRGSQAAPS